MIPNKSYKLEELAKLKEGSLINSDLEGTVHELESFKVVNHETPKI